MKSFSQISLVKLEKFANIKNTILNASSEKEFNNIQKNDLIKNAKVIKVEGKSTEMMKKKLLSKNNSLNYLCENYETNNNLLNKDKFKENNFFKKNRNNINVEENFIINKKSDFDDTG